LGSSNIRRHNGNCLDSGLKISSRGRDSDCLDSILSIRLGNGLEGGGGNYWLDSDYLTCHCSSLPCSGLQICDCDGLGLRDCDCFGIL
jgi:hypothetical protein